MNIFELLFGKKKKKQETTQSTPKTTGNSVQNKLGNSLQAKLGGQAAQIPAAKNPRTVQSTLFGTSPKVQRPVSQTAQNVLFGTRQAVLPKMKNSPKIGVENAVSPTQAKLGKSMQQILQTPTTPGVQKAQGILFGPRPVKTELSAAQRLAEVQRQAGKITPVSMAQTAADVAKGITPNYAKQNEDLFYKSRGINSDTERSMYDAGVLLNGGKSTEENPVLTGITYPATKFGAGVLNLADIAHNGYGLAENKFGQITGNKALEDKGRAEMGSNWGAAFNQGIEDTVRPGTAEGLLGNVANLIGGVGAASAAGAPFETMKVPASIAPKIGIGLQSGAQSTSKALSEGASTKDAVKYGVLNGTMNAATEGIAGGIPGLGEGSLDPIIRRLPGLAQIGANAAGEGFENALQEALDPVMQRATYNPNAEKASGKELLSAFGWGAALSGIMEGAGAMAHGLPEQDSIDSRIGQNLKAYSGENYGDAVAGMVEDGQKYSPDTKARQTSDKAIDILKKRTLTDKEVGRLWRANAETQRAETLAYFKGEDVSPYRTTATPTAKTVNAYMLQKAQHAYAREVAGTLAKYNVKGVVIEDMPAGESGRWANGVVYVSSKLDTASAINEKVAHEIGHAAGESDSAFTNDVLKVIENLGVDIEAETEKKRAIYADFFKKQGMSTEEIAFNTTDERMHDEIVCDYIGAALKDGDLAGTLTDRPNIAKRMLDAVNTLRGHSVSQPEASRYAVLAGKLRAALDVEGNARIYAAVPTARFAIDAQGNADFSAKEIEDGFQTIAKMETVATLTGEEFEKGDKDLTTQVADFFDYIGDTVHNEQLGDVDLTRKGVKDDIAHGIGRKKAASFAAVPDVIEKGRVIDYQHNWKGRHYDTAVVAAPVKIGGESYIEGIVLIRNEGKNRFYLHEVLTEKGDVPSFKTGTDQKASVPGDGKSPLFNLLLKARNVKSNILAEKENLSTAPTINAGGALAAESGDQSGSQVSNNSILNSDGKSNSNKNNSRFSIDEPGYMDDVLREAEERDKIVQPWEETEKQAKDAGYPVLNGKQVFPFKTWVKDAERGNYGLVIGKGFDREDGELLKVSFWNKEQGARAVVELPVSELEAVSGKYQPEDAELRSLFESELADNLRGAVSAEDWEQYRSAYDEAHGIAPGTTVEYKFDELPPKAKNYAERAENKFVRDLAKVLNVPFKSSREDLKPLAREITSEYLKSGTLSNETRDKLFESAWDKGRIIDDSFFNDHEDIKAELRDTAVSISAYDAHDIPDYSDFRKRQFGKLKITNDGVPVDTRYAELSDMDESLFPREITAPSDQLLQMAKVADAIKKSESSLDDYFGENAETYKTAAKTEFEDAMTGYLPELAQIRKYYEQRAREKTEKADLLKFAGNGLNDADVKAVNELWQEARRTQKQAERAVSRNLLTEADNQFVDRLLRREANVDEIPDNMNAKGIRAVFEAKEEYQGYKQQLDTLRRSLKGARRAKADTFLTTITEWKDKKMPLSYDAETMERNVRDIIKDRKLADKMIDWYFTPVHEHSADANRLKNYYRGRIKALDLSLKVEKGNRNSESAAVQIMGEAECNIADIREQMRHNSENDWMNGKTLNEWQNMLKDLEQQNPNMDFDKIGKAVKEFRDVYDEIFEMMNATRIRNGYEPVPYRKGYFPHFQKETSDNLKAKLQRHLGIETATDELPTSINGLTESFRPGTKWFGNAQERKGFETEYDAVKGLDRYIEGAAEVICHTDDLQNLRALEDQIRYRSTTDSIREQVDKLRSDKDLSMEEREAKISEVYEKAPTAGTNFVLALNEYTNILAGKKSKYDRQAESAIGRAYYGIAKKFESRVAANMVAGNISSAMTNFIPLVQGSTGVTTKEMLDGMTDTLKAYKKGDDFANCSTFLTNRRGSDPLVKTMVEKASGIASLPMEYIDQFTADTLVRARYAHNIHAGMAENDAMSEADSWAAGVMADRSKGAQPNVFAATNPFYKLFTQFQLEINNQLRWMFKDLPTEFKGKGVAAIATALMKFLIGSWVYNELYEKLFGRRPALDPVGMLNRYVGDASGKKLPNSIDMLRDAMQGKPPDFTTEKKTHAEAASAAIKDVEENLPFIGGVMGGGRIPISSALPDWGSLGMALLNQQYGEGNEAKNKATIRKELSAPLYYVAPPFGGGQIKKGVEGGLAAKKHGVYGVDKEGRDTLKYPVGGKGETIQSILFGPTSTRGGQKWIESGFKSLSADATDVYKKLVDGGSRERDAYDFVKQLAGAQKTGSQSKRDVQIGLLAGSKLDEDQKLIAYRGMMASDKEKAVIDTIGVSEGDLSTTLAKIGQTSKSGDKRAALAASGLPDDEKEIIYTKLISDKNPEIMKTCLKDGMSMDEYMKYADAFEGSKDYAEKYQSMKTAGLSGSSAAEILTGLADLQPATGKNEVTFVQKLRVIADADLSDEQKLQAVGAAMDKTTVQKVNQARGYGINVDLYTEFQETLPRFDANGNGSYTQAEVKAALDNMQVSNKERAVLWQLRTGGKKNPYDSSIGANIRAEAAADKQAGKGQTVQEALFGGNSGRGKSTSSSGTKKAMTANDVLFG